VARLYAGILGLLAFVTTLVRGMLHGGGPESVLWSAWCNLLLFTVVGCLVGGIARWIVEDAVHSRYAVANIARPMAKTPGLGNRFEVGE
jgi:hypothetical protein